MTNQEIAEKTLDEMYTFIMSGISAASSALGGKTGAAFSVWMGGVDGATDLATSSGDNHYEAVGRTVGNMIGVIGSFASAKYIKSITVSVKAQAGGAFVTNEAFSHSSLGDIFANLFNTYVANADAFYSKILSDADYASTVWEGITKNGLNTYVNYFDPDGDGNVSPSDIVNGYKKLFSPPPAFGTIEFEALYSSSNKSTIIIKTQDEEAQKVGIEAVVQYENIKSITLNNQTLDIVTPTNLQLRNALESIADYQFLLSDVLIKPDEMLDMGAAGVVTVSSGDTLSELAVKYLGGNAVDATRNAVLLNPWLADEGRINFIADTNKILMKAGASIEDTNVDHVYKNEESADFFYDANGGFDTYLTGKDDIVQDSDGKGLIKFKDIDLTGTKTLKKDTTDTYQDDDFIYKKDADGNLIVSKQTSTGEADSQDSITINNFQDKDLGITLQETQDIDVSVGDASEIEAAQEMTVEVEILRELGDDESLDVELGYYYDTYKTEYGPEVYVAATAAKRMYDNYTKTWTLQPATEAHTYRPEIYIKTGEEFAAVGSVNFTKADGQTQEFTYTWQDDKRVGVTGNSHIVSYNETTKIYSTTSTPSITLTTKKDDTSSLADDIKVTTIRQGTLTIIDDDEAQRTDPLVLDMNKDGFISTTALADSNTYFDITGDGLRERVGWVSPEDGLLKQVQIWKDKKQKIKSINNDFYMQRFVEIDKKEVA